MAFKMKYKAGSNRLEADYGCGVPSRVIAFHNLGYIKEIYGKEAFMICSDIYACEKALKLDCVCEDSINWQIIESVVGGYIDNNNKEIVELRLSVLCPECGTDEATICLANVKNKTYECSEFFSI